MVNSSWRVSFSTRRSFMRCSSSSLRLFSASTSSRLASTTCLMSAICSSECARCCSTFWTSSNRAELMRASISVFCFNMSRSFSSCSRCADNWPSCISCSAFMPAPWSIRRWRSTISALCFSMVCFAVLSLSKDCSTIFCCASMSRRSVAICCWSSAAVFMAVCTLWALALISAFKSRIFFVRRFSDSCEHNNALYSFSYSALNGSTTCALGPANSLTVSW
mmetsp:Transcript_87247/g.267020  ORF Transcript_87247/g.267020 Transcript_87247/m.267020 type:complete len:221 (-) Transcript_87247:164-826(-)